MDFLPDEAMAWFLSRIKGRKPSDFVFMNDQTKRPFAKFAHLFRAAVREAGLPRDFSFYGLRHTYASQLMQAGAPVTAVAQQLGHANPITVFKTYGHLSPQIRESEIRQRFTTLDTGNVRMARSQRDALRRWRKTLHGADWRTYAAITDTRSRLNKEHPDDCLRLTKGPTKRLGRGRAQLSPLPI